MSDNSQNKDFNAAVHPISFDSFNIDDNSDVELYLDFSEILKGCEGEDEDTDYTQNGNDSFTEKYFPDTDKVYSPDKLSDFQKKHGNKQAVYTALKVIQNIDSQKYQPFYIYGEALIPTELMLQALLNEIRDLLPEYTVCYIDVGSLVSKINNCLFGKEISIIDPKKALINVLQKYDIILFNNLNFLAYDDMCLEIFSEAVIRLKDKGKQFVFTAHSRPEELNFFPDEIIYYLKSGFCKKLD